ncbi:MAG: D-alanine--D-alanine ligase family protein [Candidatus Limnocylindria bacterium]
MTKKIRVGVFAGGASAERQISLASGMGIAEHLAGDRYEVVMLDPLALMSNNPWLSDEQRALARNLAARGGTPEALPARDQELPAAMQEQMHRASSALVPATVALSASPAGDRIDVAFIALHGPWGEDGKLQGVLDTLGIPYTGSGVLASALAMDKAMAKTVLAANGLDVPEGEIVTSPAQRPSIAPPSVVKPVENGSSVGITMVDDPKHYAAAIAEALKYDARALVEERIAGRELTVGIIGLDALQALPVIEIVTTRAFFDYRAKYDSSASEELCPAPIPDEVARRAQDFAVRAHRALGCRGISRTDLMWDGDRMAILEVNTMPGMTPNSLVPKAAAVAGISYAQLVDRLIGWALEPRRR